MIKILIIIRLVPKFLHLCWKYPFDLRENFEDVKTMYWFRVDPEMQKLDKQLDDV